MDKQRESYLLKAERKMCEVLLGCRKSNDLIRKDFECGFWVINALMKGQRAKSRESGFKLVFWCIHEDIFIRSRGSSLVSGSPTVGAPGVARFEPGQSYLAGQSFFVGDCSNCFGIAPGLSRLE